MTYEPYTAGRVLAIFGTVLGYYDDLYQSRFDHFQGKLRHFVNEAERDDIFRQFTAELHYHGEQKALDWYQARATGQGADVPEGEAERLTLAYCLLWLASRHKIEPRSLIVNCFEGPSLPDKLDDFKRLLLKPLKDGLEQRRHWMERRFGHGEPLDMDTFPFQLFYRFEALRDQAAPATEVAKPAAAPPEPPAPAPRPAAVAHTPEPEAAPEPVATAPEPAPPPEVAPEPVALAPEPAAPDRSMAPSPALAPPPPAPPAPAPGPAPVTEGTPFAFGEPTSGPRGSYTEELDELRQLVRDARFRYATEKDRLIDIDILELQLKKERPDLLHMKMILTDLATLTRRTSIRDAGQELIERFLREF